MWLERSKQLPIIEDISDATPVWLYFGTTTKEVVLGEAFVEDHEPGNDIVFYVEGQSGYHRDYNVTHWMYANIPEPPKH